MPIELSEEQIAEFKSVFKKFDENGDNTISISELKNVFDALSIDVTDKELKNIVIIRFCFICEEKII
jgi:Ca2+-binding EF-hand superfamily protein